MISRGVWRHALHGLSVSVIRETGRASARLAIVPEGFPAGIDGRPHVHSQTIRGLAHGLSCLVEGVARLTAQSPGGLPESPACPLAAGRCQQERESAPTSAPSANPMIGAKLRMSVLS